MLRLVLVAVAVVLSGCVVTPDSTPTFLPALEPFDPSEPGWRKTRPALLVADCQLHNPYALPVPDRNLSIKMLADTAIRPPQLDVFSADILRWILAHGAPDAECIIHLGDAIDLACEGELVEFLEVMANTRLPWLMAPGNHECFYFGSYDPRNLQQWQEACHGSGAPIPKDHFVRLYVAAILAQDDPGVLALAAKLGLLEARGLDLLELARRIPDQFSWEAAAGSPGLLEAIVWKIDPLRPWRSFVLQRANLSGSGPDGVPFRAILLDSCQYAEMPALVPSAWDNYPPELNCGLTGQLLADQLRIVRRWAEESGDEQLVFICHHPVNNLSAKSRSSILWLWGRYSVGGFITAHTHDGHFVHHDLADDRDGLELNLGSTSDWPMEWRTLQFFVRGAEAYLQSNRYTLADMLRNRDGYFTRGWEVPQGADDDYRKYKVGEASGLTIADFVLEYHLYPPILGRPRVAVSRAARDTEAQVKDTMLWTYDRLIRTFPTDPRSPGTRWPSGCRNDTDVRARLQKVTGLEIAILEKIAVMQELARFEKTRSSRDPQTGRSTDDDRARFKLSQAVWASRYEYTSGRRLRPDDDLIRVRVQQ